MLFIKPLVLSVTLFLILGFTNLGFINRALAQTGALDDAIAQLNRGQIEQARALFLQHKAAPEALVYLAKIAMNDDPDQAEEWIEKAVKLAPDNAHAHFIRGRVMGQQASNAVFSALSYAKKSKASFLKAVELQPTEIDYHIGLMQFYLQAPSFAGGDIDAAKGQVKAIQQLDSKAGFKAEVDFLLATDQLQQAQGVLVQAQLDYPASPDFYFKAGMLQLGEEKFADAIGNFSKASQLEVSELREIQTKYAAMYQLGRTAVLSKTNLELGVSALSQYIASAPFDIGAIPKHWAQFRLANLYALQNKQAEAKRIYQMLAKVDDQRLQKEVKQAMGSL
jgi:tetratricopeptide (TPR) repeat protein